MHNANKSLFVKQRLDEKSFTADIVNRTNSPNFLDVQETTKKNSKNDQTKWNNKYGKRDSVIHEENSEMSQSEVISGNLDICTDQDSNTNFHPSLTELDDISKMNQVEGNHQNIPKPKERSPTKFRTTTDLENLDYSKNFDLGNSSPPKQAHIRKSIDSTGETKSQTNNLFIKKKIPLLLGFLDSTDSVVINPIENEINSSIDILENDKLNNIVEYSSNEISKESEEKSDKIMNISCGESDGNTQSNLEKVDEMSYTGKSCISNAKYDEISIDPNQIRAEDPFENNDISIEIHQQN